MDLQPRFESYRSPHVVEPASGEHKQTFIILHGRGDMGHDFGPQLLCWPVADEYENLQTAFPNVKCIFPTAAQRRARVFNNTLLHQWFDIRSLIDPEEDPDLQYEGLRESTDYVCHLLRSAIDEVGPRNVVLWGLSQGSAITLMTLLHWDGEPIAAAVGMCGWLPLRRRMLQASAAAVAETAASDDVFQRSEDGVRRGDRLDYAVACLREVVGLDPSLSDDEHVCKRIPIFLGHGVQDEKVAVDLGRDSRDFLRSMGLEDVRWREYPELDHWYSEHMLQDIIDFLTERCKFDMLAD